MARCLRCSTEVGSLGRCPDCDLEACGKCLRFHACHPKSAIAQWFDEPLPGMPDPPGSAPILPEGVYLGAEAESVPLSPPGNEMSLEIRGAWGWVVMVLVTSSFLANAGAVLYAANIHRSVSILELRQDTHEREQREQMIVANAEINRRLGAIEARMDTLMTLMPSIAVKPGTVRK